MARLSLWQRLSPVRRGRRPGKPAAKRKRGPLAVEQLEDRCVPSTLQAISLPNSFQPPSDTAAGASVEPSVSADGRYVAFESRAPNLLPGQTGAPFPGLNVYLLDRSSNVLTLVSHPPGSPTAATDRGEDIYGPVISRDGRFILYDTDAPELVTPPTSGIPQAEVLLYDRQTGANTLVSHASGSLTTAVDAIADPVAISGDGRYLVFQTTADDVVPGQVTTTDQPQLYLYDRVAATTALITHADGQPATTANGGSYNGATVADDGRVAFNSQTTNLVGSTQINNVYLYDPVTRTNRLISTVSGFPTADAGNSFAPVISRDGSTVAFISLATDLVPGQTGGGVANVFRYSLASGQTKLVSGAGGSASAGGNADSGGAFGAAPPVISDDGRFIAFVSKATNLVAGQTGPAGNIFLYDAQSPGLTLLSGVQGSRTAAAGGVPDLLAFGRPGGTSDPITGNGTEVLSMSGDGGLVAYVSAAGNLVPGQTGPANTDNVFLYNRAAGRSSLVAAAGGGDGESGFPVLSDSGNLLAFHTLALNLVNGVFDANGVSDVLTFTPGTQTTALVSRAAFVVPKHGGPSFSTSVSADGRFTVFTSAATNLIPNQVTVNRNQNVFLFDKQTGTTALVNHVPGFDNTTGDGGVGVLPADPSVNRRPPSFLQPAISADGNFIAFASYDDNLVPGERLVVGDQGQFLSVYLYDRRADQVRLVSHVAGMPTVISGFAFAPALSADGSTVAYLFGGSPPGNFIFNSGSLARYDAASDTALTITSDHTTSSPAISDDGRFVTYVDQGQIYVYDAASNTSTLVSHASGSLTTPANGASSAPAISHDGSAIAFVSAATDLVPGQVASSFTNVFLYKNNGSGVLRLVSGARGSATAGGDGNSDSPAIDKDGSYVAYRSEATDLTSGPVFGSNVYEFNTQANTQTLVSHQAGSPAAGAGGVPQPFSFESPPVVIDDDGHLISYVSTAGNLIPGQSGPAGVKNVFVWLRQTGANILASGQGGSPTATGNADSDGPLLTRDSFPGFSSVATNLLAGLTGSSVAYINTLVAVSLSPNTVAVGSSPGSVVGSLSVSSLLAGQFLPPKQFLLPAGELNNVLFAVSGATLLIRFIPTAAQGYQVRVHVDVGFGDDAVVLSVFAAVPAPGGGFVGGPGGGGGEPLLAELVPVRVGKRKARLMIEVFDPLTGAEVEALVSPFQAPAYRGVTLTPLGPGLYRLSARKGKRTVSILLHA